MELFPKVQAFGNRLMAEAENQGNPNVGNMFNAVENYYTTKTVYFNGKTFEQGYRERTNQQIIGEASIRKEHIFIQDTWQVNKDTLFMPIVRLDHSSLFGSHVTANLGMTRNVKGNVHRRLKANIGTGYTEPGMGELYYNWEMYGGNPVGYGILDMNTKAYGGLARLGWYWEGNPDLKPEKSVNFDISLEGENKNTYAKAGLFYNRINNYMTTYFTGTLMDFSPYINESTPAGQDKWMYAPDMIYSFKNIGRAEIGGIELEAEQKLGRRWKAKLGYTYLHAINKSDPDMPRQLLDKPQHKIDIGLTYTDEKSGWSGSIWGNYYIHMLDSNSLAGSGNYMYSRIDPNDAGKSIIGYRFADKKKQRYEKKTFSLWNIMLQKKFDKDSFVYFGIDNIFNHCDDDRAFGGRVYRFGVNMKFGYQPPKEGEPQSTVSPSAAGTEKTTEPLRKDGSGQKPMADTVAKQDDFFITKPFDTAKKRGVEVIGDYRARWNSHGGTNRPAATASATTDISDAAKNMLDRSEHGFEQRLRLGINARIGDNTNLTLIGSASGAGGVDTAHEIASSKGLNHQRLERVDITQHVKKWDFSIGRLKEFMGVTGYWFGKEFDGARAVWTSGRSQVRIGYGDFGHSTGIVDSPYTRATRELFYRAPTVDEFLGLKSDAGNNPAGEEIVPNAGNMVNFY